MWSWVWGLTYPAEIVWEKSTLSVSNSWVWYLLLLRSFCLFYGFIDIVDRHRLGKFTGVQAVLFYKVFTYKNSIAPDFTKVCTEKDLAVLVVSREMGRLLYAKSNSVYNPSSVAVLFSYSIKYSSCFK